MKAWVIEKISDLKIESNPLKMVEIPKPEPKDGEILIKVKACGVCHTEIDEIEGRTPPPVFPVVPGHQAIGIVEEVKTRATEQAEAKEKAEAEGKAMNTKIKLGDRVGVAWIYSSCGKCEYCLSGRENLCTAFLATGRDANGGYAEYMVVPERYTYRIPELFTDAEAAPLLCAGAIGYRSLWLCNATDGQRIGLTGFGASAHLVLKLIKYQYPNSEVYVFARNFEEREFALELGANWAGDTTDQPPALLDCIIDTTPVWKTVVFVLQFLKPGGRLVINAIRKESIDKEYLFNIDYKSHLWMEKEIKSVANVSRHDVQEFIRIAAEMPFKPEVEIYPFKNANQAIMDIKHRKIKGAKVLMM